MHIDRGDQPSQGDQNDQGDQTDRTDQGDWTDRNDQGDQTNQCDQTDWLQFRSVREPVTIISARDASASENLEITAIRIILSISLGLRHDRE